MDELIFKHLERNYFIIISSFVVYRLCLKSNKSSIRLNFVVDELKTIFGLPHEELVEIVLKWVEKKSIIINNEMV
jgi:hypothetical protein